MQERITGFDFARSLALLGMIIVNFTVVMNPETGSTALLSLTQLLQGRASALFVIIAGIGVTLSSNKSRLSNDTLTICCARSKLIRRALLMIVVGLLFTVIWEGDILVFYGFYFLFAASLFTKSNHTLLFACVVLVLLFPLLLMFFDYEKNWDWSTLTYTDLWSAEGLIRRIFFNGFHPVLPWTAFVIFGMWLARQNLADTKIRQTLLKCSLALFSCTELGCYLLNTMYVRYLSNESSMESSVFLFSTAAIPPLPQYMASAGSFSVIVIISSLYFCERFSESRFRHWICQTGRLTLTLYISHVIVGLGVLEYLGLLENQTIHFALLAAAIFFVAAIVFSTIWLKYFRTGPLEYLFNRIVAL